MKQKEVILHIGIGKAGSSSIQKFCDTNRTYLTDLGILYPYDQVSNGLGGDNNKALALSFSSRNNLFTSLPKNMVGHAKNIDDWRDQLLKAYNFQFKHSQLRILLSAEQFWSEMICENKLREFKLYLENQGIHATRIVVYFRNQLDWIESYMAQKCRELTYNLDLYDINFIKSRLDYKKTCELWSATFPNALLIIRPFDKSKWTGNDLISDFFNYGLSIDSSAIASRQDGLKAANTTSVDALCMYLAMELIKIIRTYNQNLPFGKLRDRIESTFAVLVRLTAAEVPKFTFLSTAEYEEIASAVTTSNNALFGPINDLGLFSSLTIDLLKQDRLSNPLTLEALRLSIDKLKLLSHQRFDELCDLYAGDDKKIFLLIFHFLNALDFDRQQRMSLGADGFDFIMKSLDQLDLQAF
jgi:hypothetical protein